MKRIFTPVFLPNKDWILSISKSFKGESDHGTGTRRCQPQRGWIDDARRPEQHGRQRWVHLHPLEKRGQRSDRKSTAHVHNATGGTYKSRRPQNIFGTVEVKITL